METNSILPCSPFEFYNIEQEIGVVTLQNLRLLGVDYTIGTILADKN